MPTEQDLTYQDLKRLHRPQASAARSERVFDFGNNLETAPAHEGHRVLYNVTGQAGTGKTWLLREFAAAAARADVPTGWADEAQETVLEAMRRLAQGLHDGGCFRTYLERDAEYLRLLAEVLTDPAAPTRVAAALGRGLGRATLAAGRQIPGISLVLSFADDEAFGEGGAEIATYLATRFKRPEQLALVLEPVETLTPLFLIGLRELASGGRPVALFFDTFERTRVLLEPWLIEVFAKAYGDIPASTVWSVAGQTELHRSRWSEHEPWIERIGLDVFSPDESRAYLAQQDIRDERLVSEILRVSGRLPILLATLASQSPNRLEDLGDATDTAIDVFLKWIIDPAQRELALLASIPRRVNRDIVGVILEDSDPRHFAWLREMPFVQARASGWEYHEVVRAQMLRDQIKTSPDRWSAIHDRLARYYESRGANASGDTIALGSPGVTSSRYDDEAQALYHKLAIGGSALSDALPRFVSAYASDLARAKSVATAIREAGRDSGDRGVERWGATCLVLTHAEVTAPTRGQAFTQLIDSGQIRAEPLLMHLYHWRGHERGREGEDILALADFTEALRLDPADARYYGDVALCHMRLNNMTDALDALDRGLEHARDDGLRAWLLINRADVALRQSDITAARADADAAIALSGNSGSWFIVRGKIRRAEGDQDAAIADFRTAMRLDERSSHESLQEIGATHRAAGRPSEAESALVESLRLQPDCGHCWRELVAIVVGRDREHAAEALRTIRDAVGSTVDGLWSRATALADAGLYDAAVEDLDSVVEHVSHDASANDLNALGLWLTYSGRIVEAIDMYEQGLSKDADNPLLLYNVAVARARHLGHAAALPDLERSASRLQSELDAGRRVTGYYGLAGLSAVKGDTTSALMGLAAAVHEDRERVSGWVKRDIAWLDLRGDQRLKDALEA